MTKAELRALAQEAVKTTRISRIPTGKRGIRRSDSGWRRFLMDPPEAQTDVSALQR